MDRRVEPEFLDQLPAEDSRAIRSRRDLQRVNAWMGNVGTMARALRCRDKGCVFPGCGATRFVQGHHVTHWVHGGETSLENLTQLCWFHHHLIHEGGFGLVKDSETRALVFSSSLRTPW